MLHLNVRLNYTTNVFEKLETQAKALGENVHFLAHVTLHIKKTLGLAEGLEFSLTEN